MVAPIMAAPPEQNNTPSPQHRSTSNKPSTTDTTSTSFAAANSHSVMMSAMANNRTQLKTFHPEIMFCGDCTACIDPPEPSPSHLEGLLMDEDPSENDEDDADNGNGGGSIRSKLVLPNLNRPSQVVLLQSLLLPLPGVTKVLIPNIKEQILMVDHGAETDQNHIMQNLKDAGFPCRLFHVPTSPEECNYLCRSQLFVGGICCASECPAIRKILLPFPGISKVQINITTKAVYVHHDSSLIAIKLCADALNKQGFHAKVIKDGHGSASTITGTVGKTTLHSERALHDRDVQKIQACLNHAGVKRIGVNVAESVIYIVHDTEEITSDLVQTFLTEGQYATSVATDAKTDIRERNANALQVTKSKYVESTLVLSNLSLAHIPLVQKAFKQNYIRTQLRAFYPHVQSRTIKIEHNPTLLKVTAVGELLKRYGLQATVAIDGGVEHLCLPLMEDYVSDNNNDTYNSGGMGHETEQNFHWNVIFSGVFWFLSLLSAIGGNWKYLEYAGILSVVLGLPPVAMKAWRTVKRCQFDANCMMVIAAFGALALQEYDEAASVAFLFSISEFLEARATSKARIALGAIISLRPDHANVIHPISKELVVVPAEKVPIGSLISVRTGDKIAADGIVVEGTSNVDESSLTGEALPMLKRPNDLVSGGSINIGTTRLVIKTTTTVEDSAVSRLIRMVEEAQANRSPTEKLIDSFAKTYTPVVIIMAGLMCTVPWYFGEETGRYWTLNGLIIVVIACPCALTISTPVTYAAGLAAAAQRGVIIKGGASLESLGSVEKVVFDKTGTLTQGKFEVIHLQNVGDKLSRKELLETLALMEAPSSHPLSATLVNAAKREGAYIPRDANVEEHTILKGEGVSAIVNGKRIYVGNKRLFERLGMFASLPQLYQDAAVEWNNKGGTVGFLGVEEDGIVGAFCVSDAVREEAKDVIAGLQEGGIEVFILTGDGDGAAKSVGKQVGVPEHNIHSQLLPEEKLHFIGGLKTPSPKTACPTCATKSLVLMCGDGVNDAPALAVADVGVAMGEGATLAMEMSDITLMDSHLTKLLFTIKMGARVIVTIQENIMLSVLAKLVVVGLTFAGKMTLLSAIAADVGVMLIVTLNGMKLLPSGKSGKKALDQKTAQRLNAKMMELPIEGKSLNSSTKIELV